MLTVNIKNPLKDGFTIRNSFFFGVFELQEIK